MISPYNAAVNPYTIAPSIWAATVSGINHLSAIDGTNNAMHLYMPVLCHRNFRYLCDIAAKTLMHRNTLKRACGRFAPVSFFGGKFHNSGMPRMFRKHRQPKRDGILARCRCNLIKETLGRKRRMRTSDRSPEADRHARILSNPIALEILGNRREGCAHLRKMNRRADPA